VAKELTARDVQWGRGRARAYIRAWGLPRRLAEDVVAVCLLGLAEAARSFLPRRGATFKQSARRRMEEALREFLTAEGEYARRHVPLARVRGRM